MKHGTEERALRKEPRSSCGGFWNGSESVQGMPWCGPVMSLPCMQGKVPVFIWGLQTLALAEMASSKSNPSLLRSVQHLGYSALLVLSSQSTRAHPTTRA